MGANLRGFFFPASRASPSTTLTSEAITRRRRERGLTIVGRQGGVVRISPLVLILRILPALHSTLYKAECLPLLTQGGVRSQANLLCLVGVEGTDTEFVSNRYARTKATVTHGPLQSRSAGSAVRQFISSHPIQAVLLIREERQWVTGASVKNETA